MMGNYLLSWCLLTVVLPRVLCSFSTMLVDVGVGCWTMRCELCFARKKKDQNTQEQNENWSFVMKCI